VHEGAAEGVLELFLAPELCGSLRARPEARTESQRDSRRIDERAVDIKCNYPTTLASMGRQRDIGRQAEVGWQRELTGLPEGDRRQQRDIRVHRARHAVTQHPTIT
jgi:hypothetical protein